MNIRKLRVESLEERALLAVIAGGFEQAAELAAPTEATTWVVDTLDDPTEWDTTDDVLSLREAIGSASTGDTIVFDDSLAGETIVLSGNQLEITQGIVIDATSIGGITIDAYDQSRVLYVEGGDQANPVELIGLTITGGWANGDGGGVFNNGKLTIVDCLISGNSASRYGGGIGNEGRLTLCNSIISDNSTNDGGGGISNLDYGRIEAIGCRISKNTSNSWGGGIYINATEELTLTNSVISGNSANEGGGVFNYGFAKFTNVIILGNSARNNSGGIFNGGSLSLINNTITGNTADNYAGGILSNNNSLVLTNSIVSINYAGYDNDISRYYGSVTGSNNIIGLDPGFVVAPVFKNGRLVNLDELDLSLTAGSYAIDHGTNDAVDTEIDIVGTPRIFAAWKEIPTVDIGAYEYNANVEKGEVEIPSTVVTTNLDVFDDTDGLISLREAISYAASGDTVTFDSELAGATIILDNAEIVIDKDITIDAENVGMITIDGKRNSGIFHIEGLSDVISVVLISLSIKNGYTYSGGGIYNASSKLTLANCIVSGNSALANDRYDGGYGGGIFNTATGILILNNCSISMNQANGGGGIYNGGTINGTNCLITNNVGRIYGGGGSYNDYGTLTLVGCTIARNTSRSSSGGLNTNRGIVKFYNSIIADNSDDIESYESFVYAYNSLSSYTSWSRSAGCSVYDGDHPLFTDPEHGDYNLAANAQTINTGNNDYVTTETDLAGNPRILNGVVDLGAYEYTGVIEPLDSPTILTGTRGVYVSYGANRHQVTWSAVDRAASYEFAYSEDGGNTWVTLETNDTSAVVRGLAYGEEVSYRVRALSTRYLENSEWSATKTFRVCPMDINNDGDISGFDRSLMASAWGTEEGDENYRYYADINGDGDLTGFDRNLLSSNWGLEADDEDLLYPRPRAAADIVFAEFASLDIAVDLDVF